MSIIINKTYEIITEESAEQGEVEEHGYVYQDVEISFRDLVDMLREFPLGSSWPGIPRWASSEQEQDYVTGEWYSESIHPGDDARSQRYWTKAWQYVYGK